MWTKTYRWGRAYRNGHLVCRRVRVTIGHNGESLGLLRRERRYVRACFQEHMDRSLEEDLKQLADKNGAAAHRTAEALQPITIIVDDDKLGEVTIQGNVEPLETRPIGSVRDLEFRIREDITRATAAERILPIINDAPRLHA